MLLRLQFNPLRLKAIPDIITTQNSVRINPLKVFIEYIMECSYITTLPYQLDYLKHVRIQRAHAMDSGDRIIIFVGYKIRDVLNVI